MHRLIIVEGLPCSGKSTASRVIAERLGARWFDEGTGGHPADYEFHGFLREDELGELSPEDREAVLEKAEACAGGYAVPLGGFQGELFDWLLGHKIYDFLPWEVERPVMLDRWKRFAGSVRDGERYVFNCVLLQNPMCETMMRFGYPLEVSAGYIGEIADIIRGLEPFVVYLGVTDIRRQIERYAGERGQEWLDGVVGYHCGGGYGKALGLRGFDGYIEALEERQRRELQILPGLGLRHLVLRDPFRDWEGAYGEMLDGAKGE